MEAQEPQPHRADAREAQPPARILLVEDDADVAGMIRFILESERYEVAHAANGREALELLRGASAAGSPELILLDMKMPVMDGREFARRLREGPGPHPPIVILTAAVEAQALAHEVGADAWLGKPFDVDALTEIARRMTP